jgi:AcrR family transcriptional regulator
MEQHPLSGGGTRRPWPGPPSERQRILTALAELVAEQGYASTSEDQIIERAGVPRAAFDRRFADKEDCLLAAHDAALGHAFGAAAHAFLRTGGTWAEATRAALAGMLEVAAGSPALTQLCMTAAFHESERAAERHNRAIELFTGFLEPGYATSGEPAAGTRLTREMIAGGIFELIRAHVVEQRLDELPNALPSVTILTLTPFVGREEAGRMAGLSPGGPAP